jgi:hypothetical protein
MKHNYICIVGAIPIGIFGYIWRSHTMLLSSFIGVIFHIHPNNNTLKYMDLAMNSCFSLRATLYDYKIMLLAIFSGICYILNSRVYNIYNTNKTLCNIRHVLLVQLVGVYGYYLLRCHKPCIDFYFDCSDYYLNNTIII